MIYSLYGLREEYRDKRVYIWNVNRTSMTLFTKIVFMSIHIQGFVTIEDEYIGQTYMNRPVVTVEQVEQERDSIILVADEVSKDTISMLPADKVIYWSNALGINERLKEEKIIIYGIGYGADQIDKLLQEKKIEAKLYCITQKREEDVLYRGKKLIEATELEQYNNYAVIISVVKERDRKEILETLCNLKFHGSVYVRYIIEETVVSQINLIQSLASAARKQKEVYVYGSRNLISELIENVLLIYGIRIRGYLSEVEDEEKNIQCLYECMSEEIENKLVIISEIIPERFIQARESLEAAGLSIEKGNYTGILNYTNSNNYMLENLKVVNDSLVGASILYEHGRPGWKVYGNEQNGNVRILVLGGSTSSEVFFPENWVSKLYHKFKQRDVKVTIYNGAHVGNDIVDEILRLLRDGHELRPQIVVSMSGANNTYYKECVNQFNSRAVLNWVQSLSNGKEYCSGVPDEESLYFFWSRNQKILKMIADFYGAFFLGVLQPMNITMNHMNLWEKSVFELENHLKAVDDFKKLAGDGGDYLNLMRMFEHSDEMYLDMAHYSDKANAMIADKIYETLMPVIERLH